jgi:hypothetical protein
MTDPKLRIGRVLLQISPLQELIPGTNRQEGSLRKLKAIDYTCGLSVVIVGLGLHSYYVRELLVALLFFGAAFFFLALAVLGAFLIWWAGAQMAIWTRPTTRNMIVLSRRLITAYARP